MTKLECAVKDAKYQNTIPSHPPENIDHENQKVTQNESSIPSTFMLRDQRSFKLLSLNTYCPYQAGKSFSYVQSALEYVPTQNWKLVTFKDTHLYMFRDQCYMGGFSCPMWKSYVILRQVIPCTGCSIKKGNPLLAAILKYLLEVIKLTKYVCTETLIASRKYFKMAAKSGVSLFYGPPCMYQPQALEYV